MQAQTALYNEYYTYRPNTHTGADTHTGAHTHTHTHTHVRAQTHTNIYTHTPTHIAAQTTMWNVGWERPTHKVHIYLCIDAHKQISHFNSEEQRTLTCPHTHTHKHTHTSKTWKVID